MKDISGASTLCSYYLLAHLANDGILIGISYLKTKPLPYYRLCVSSRDWFIIPSRVSFHTRVVCRLHFANVKGKKKKTLPHLTSLIRDKAKGGRNIGRSTRSLGKYAWIWNIWHSRYFQILHQHQNYCDIITNIRYISPSPTCKSKNMGSVFNLSCSVAKCSVFRQLLIEKQYILKRVFPSECNRAAPLASFPKTAVGLKHHMSLAKTTLPPFLKAVYLCWKDTQNNINQLNGSETTPGQP